MIEKKIESFFAFARERHSIYLRRQNGDPWPWTADPILQKYKFTNIFRELDRTTMWFKNNVREAMRNDPSVLLATVLFRWFCKQEIGEVIFGQGLLEGGTPWTVFLETGDTSSMRAAILSAYPRGPYVTGAYMLRSPTGMSKLDGMLHLCSEFWKNSNWCAKADCLLNGWGEAETLTMEAFTRWLQETPGQGPFLAFEVACDLQYTALLENALDIMTWANIGPGCRRGMNRICELINPGSSPRQQRTRNRYSWPAMFENKYLEKMRELLVFSKDPRYWPQDWRSWDMRTVEHTLCESDKYARVLNGEGEPKQLYHRH